MTLINKYKVQLTALSHISKKHVVKMALKEQVIVVSAETSASELKFYCIRYGQLKEDYKIRLEDLRSQRGKKSIFDFIDNFHKNNIIY